MTQDEIIRMARGAGLNIPDRRNDLWMPQLERFATLVADNEREACAKEILEELDNLRKETIAQCQQGMVEAYKLGKSEEREACAKVCEEMWAGGYGPSAITAAIRARTK